MFTVASYTVLRVPVCLLLLLLPQDDIRSLSQKLSAAKMSEDNGSDDDHPILPVDGEPLAMDYIVNLADLQGLELADIVGQQGSNISTT